MSPRPDVSQERKRQIIDAALKVFTRLGLDQARMDDIVAESGLSKGGLYWYFKSKDEIVSAILESLFQREMTRLQALVEAEGSAHERLMTFVEHTVTELRTMTRLRPILYEFYALAFRNPAVRKALQADFRRYLTIAEPLFQQGIDRGEFRAVDAQQAAHTAAAIIEGTLLVWVVAPTSFDLGQQVEAGFRLFLDGLECSLEPAARQRAARKAS